MGIEMGVEQYRLGRHDNLKSIGENLRVQIEEAKEHEDEKTLIRCKIALCQILTEQKKFDEILDLMRPHLEHHFGFLPSVAGYYFGAFCCSDSLAYEEKARSTWEEVEYRTDNNLLSMREL